MNAPGARRLGRVLVFVSLSALAVVATWTWGVNPVRTWFEQREAIAQLEVQLTEVRDSNASLASEIELLQTDAEIERIARRDLGLVNPGEEAYAIDLPAAVVGAG